MAYRRIDDNDTIEIRRAQGGNKPETRTVAELNEYFSKEEPAIAAGAPIAPVAATGTAFETNTLTYTAKTKGAAGNSIVVNLIDPEKDTKVETVSVNGSTINVTLASAEGAITSDLDDVKAAIDGDTAAAALIGVAIGGSGATIAAEASTQLENGVDGTPGAAGSLRYSNDALYVSIDESTTAVSNWEAITFNNE